MVGKEVRWISARGQGDDAEIAERAERTGAADGVAAVTAHRSTAMLPAFAPEGPSRMNEVIAAFLTPEVRHWWHELMRATAALPPVVTGAIAIPVLLALAVRSITALLVTVLDRCCCSHRVVAAGPGRTSLAYCAGNLSRRICCRCGRRPAPPIENPTAPGNERARRARVDRPRQARSTSARCTGVRLRESRA